MPCYESIFIVRPALSDEDTDRIISKMKGVLEKSGATLEKTENWGKKRLAYEIKRERKGTFVYFQFNSEGSAIHELERSYRLEDSVIKFITIKQDREVSPQPVSEEKDPDRDGV